MIKLAVHSVLAVLLSASTVFAQCPNQNQGRTFIYPTAKQLPENLLRFYIYYPSSMGKAEGLRNIRLLDEAGSPIKGVFLTNREDLWSPDRRRLTLLLNPGRVKTGLEAHEALGRALVSGRSYTLEISGTSLTSNGCELGADIRHSFKVKAADIEPPDPSRWVVVPPAATSTQPLIIKLGSAHDHLSLAFRLRVHANDGAILPGAIALGKDEASWAFTPHEPWARTSYTLVIDESLEDLTGNRPGLPFDLSNSQNPKPWKKKIRFIPTP